MLVRLLSSLLVGCLELVGSSLAAQLDSASCLQLGFNPAKLLCSACEDLRQFDLAVLAGDCGRCCNSDGGSANLENTKYEKAILEVCG